MDKYEYKVRAEEIKSLIAEGEFAEAVKIADAIDWRRVKSVMMLCTISDLYKINRRFQESKDILLMAYERHPDGRLIVYSLCELSIKMGEYVQAIEYYKEFVQVAPRDTGRYILQYKLYEAQDVSLEERIAVLEEFKKRDYREKWAYELAYLYHRVGLETKCIEECDEMILWFGEGRHVMKALELKQLHQPLSPEQQEKYLRLKNEKELAEAQPEPSEEEKPEPLVEEKAAESEKIADFSQYSSQNQEEEEFRVKTVDVGQYNTINLQKELAESMKEILEEEEPREPLEEEQSSMNEMTKAIVAPLLQDTEEMYSTAETVSDATGFMPVTQEQVIIPEPQPATEEVFFEDVKDVLLEDTKEINTQEINNANLGDTKEINPKRRVIYPSAVPGKKPAEFAPDVSAPVNMVHNTHAPHLMRAAKPSGFEQMLSQEYDGQISLVVPEKNEVEKQITGQMNITDIMAEWERMKRENEEKRREDVRKRVQQHTGNMFADFDEATKTGLLEQLEKAVVEAILKEAGENVDPAKITSQKVSDIVLSVEKAKAEMRSETELEKEPETESETEKEEVQEPVEKEEEAAEETVPKTEEDSQQIEKDKSITEEANKLRSLSEEEKELFGRFLHNRKAREQIIHAIDGMSMDSYTGNIIVTGEEGAGTLDLAKALIRMLQISDSNFSGKVAKISGITLKKKNVQETLSKLTDGALIIENAVEMSSSTAEDLHKALAQENNGLLVIMEGKKDEMNLFMRKNFILADNFSSRVDIEALDDHSLVEYAKQYAEEMEYSIDDLGILALHTRIADMQTSDHEVTVAEVKELVDDAIYFADKKNVKHFCDILFGKRYDEEDMIVLREKDFMHY